MIAVDATDAVDGKLALGREVATAGAETACRYSREGIDNDDKRDRMDAVSEADKRAQDRIIEVLGERDPDAIVVAEENDARKTVPEAGPAWIVDPIDGTNNFVRDNRCWSVSLARTIDTEPVAAVTTLPAIGDTYSADSETLYRNGSTQSVSDREHFDSLLAAPIFGLKERDRSDYSVVSSYFHENLGDSRRLGSGQISLAMVACGEIDVAVSTVGMTSWDTVSGVHLVRAGGGRVTDLSGERWRHDSESLVATNGDVHDALLADLRRALEGL